MKKYYLNKLFFFIFILLYCNNIFAENIFFSAKIIDGTGFKNTIAVSLNRNVFFREMPNINSGHLLLDAFMYYIPQDDCYKLDNGYEICIRNGKIHKITPLKDFKNINVSNIDYFFNQKTESCNILKFNIINDFFLKKKELIGLKYQIYIPDSFDILRLFIIKDKNSVLKAFVVSSTMDVSCSEIKSFILNKMIQKKIIQNNQKNDNIENIQKIKTEEQLKYLNDIDIPEEKEARIRYNEAFKKMMLSNYKIISEKNNDIESVIEIDGDIVTKLDLNKIDDSFYRITNIDLYK